jgi:hypothetical protein
MLRILLLLHIFYPLIQMVRIVERWSLISGTYFIHSIVTFVKLSLDTLQGIWHAGQAAAELSLPQGVTFNSNDLGGKFHKKSSCLRLPSASVKLYLTAWNEQRSWVEAAELAGDTYLDIYSSPPGWLNLARAQSEFIQEQDILTGRAKRMFRRFHEGEKFPPGTHPTYSYGYLASQV